MPDDWIVIPNIEIAEAGRPPFEYDAVVIGPHAVYAVEIKDRRAPISGDEREWLVNGRTERSPLPSINHKARVLKSKLIEHAQALSRVWVDPLIVLATDPPVLDLTTEARMRVKLLSEVLAYLSDPHAVRQQPGAIVNLVPPILNALVTSVRPRERSLFFGAYRVLETLDHKDDETVYRARHDAMPNAPEVRLRVVSLSRYLLSDQQRAARMAQVVRDAEALALMGSHPNVVAAREVFPIDDQMVVVLPLIEGRSLRQRLALGTPLTIEERVRILSDVARGLAHAHLHHLIHRDVTPEHILLAEDGVAKLSHFSLAKIDQANGPTVWVGELLADLDVRYVAPEILNPTLGAPSPASDLYSLGCIAWELFAGRPPFADPGEAFGEFPAVPDGMPEVLSEIVRFLLRGDPVLRPSSALDVLAAIEQSSEPTVTSSVGNGPKPKYDPGDTIDGKFEVRERLGGGGFSDVYRVYWAMGDCERAVKVFNGKSGDDFKAVQREVSILVKIDHPNVVRVYDADKTQAGQWYLVSEFIDGEPLNDYISGPKRLSVAGAINAALDLLSALEAIHPNEKRIAELTSLQTLSEDEYHELQDLKSSGIVHRDVKPHNLLLTTAGAVLIDFNIASPAGSPAETQAATPAYRAPDAAYPMTWTVTVDLFGAGVTLYELVCGAHPYEAGIPRLDLRPRDPRLFRPELTGAFSRFLLKACAPLASERFTSAVEMRAALESIETAVADIPSSGQQQLPEPLARLLVHAPQNVNPIVSEFLALGAQARRSNRATRGLTVLAEATYVETKLDKGLTDALLESRHRLVLITGNAGDGKTAFIQQAEQLALRRNAEVVERSQNGNRLRYLTHDIITLYDGSQDEEDATSDEVLKRFLIPFSVAGNDDGAVRVAAINEGRLRDFILAYRDYFPKLLPVLAILDDSASTTEVDGIVVVNLNLRSITAGGDDSIFSRQVSKIVNGPFWEACSGCDYRLRCPIKHNVDTFGDPVSGKVLTERLRLLIDLVRLRRRRHLTMRDARSLIAFILFRDRECGEIADLLAIGNPIEISNLGYFQAVGGAGAPTTSMLDRGVALLTEIDVGLVANPEEDRRLASGSMPLRLTFPRRESDYLYELVEKARRDAGSGYEVDVLAAQLAHQAQRRLAFFERADDMWAKMLPYSQLHRLETALQDTVGRERDRLLLDIIEAISASEGVNDNVGALWVGTTEGAEEWALRGYRRFAAEEFELIVIPIDVPYVESTADHLELRHQLSGALLTVDLDLIEVLDRLRDGAVPSIDESRGILVNLALFKHQLLAAPMSEIYLKSEESFVKITTASNGQVRLSEAEE